LKQRTQQFALRVIKLVSALQKTREADVIGRQLLRSATSVGANYRSACRARSKADFVSKIGITEKEADESLYWLELIESGLLPPSRASDLSQEVTAQPGSANPGHKQLKPPGFARGTAGFARSVRQERLSSYRKKPMNSSPFLLPRGVPPSKTAERRSDLRNPQSEGENVNSVCD
jgi:four helix bundle protein